MRGGIPASITYIFKYTSIEWRVLDVLRVILDPCMMPDIYSSRILHEMIIEIV